MNIYKILIEKTPEIDVSEVCIFSKSMYVVSKHIGLASHLKTGNCNIPSDCGKMHTYTLKQLAEKLRSENIVESAVGLAAINSYINTPERLNESVELNAFDLAAEKGRGKNISVIGSFPHAHKMKQSGKFNNVWIFELQSQGGKFLTPDDFAEYLPQSDVTLITATTLLNHTFHSLIQYTQNSFNIMVGPSTPLHPILFDHTIDVLSGTVVTDPHLARLYLSQGASYRFAKGLSFVSLMKNT